MTSQATKQAKQLEALKQQWVKSGAYRTISFKRWYNDRAERIAQRMFDTYRVS